MELHAAGPIHKVEAPGYRPFWAVIGHDEVKEIERRPENFTNEPLAVLETDEVLEMRSALGVDIRTLIHMDEPDHGKYRKLTSDWFKPASVRRLDTRIHELSLEAVAKLESLGGEADFYRDVAVTFPLQVILSILGLPDSDYPRMYKLTQELFGAQDPDLQREVKSPEEMVEVLMDFYGYFSALTADRQAHPVDDLASLIANGTIDDAAIPDLERMGYYVIIATAGHDTTAAAMAGGLPRAGREPGAAGSAPTATGTAYECRRRDAPMDRPCPTLHAYCASRCRHRRDGGGRGGLALLVVSGGKPRPGRVRRATALRHHAQERRSAPGVRLRHPLLSWRTTSSHGTAIAVRRARPEARVVGVGRTADNCQDHVRRWPQDRADPLQAQGLNWSDPRAWPAAKPEDHRFHAT